MAYNTEAPRVEYTANAAQDIFTFLFKIYTKNMPLGKDINLEELARATKGYSGADIEALCREAALNALRRDINAKEVVKADFDMAMEKIGPSISPEIEEWYKSFMRQIRRVQRPPSLVA